MLSVAERSGGGLRITHRTGCPELAATLVKTPPLMHRCEGGEGSGSLGRLVR